MGQACPLGLSLSAPLTLLAEAEPGSLPVARCKGVISASQPVTPLSISNPLSWSPGCLPPNHPLNSAHTSTYPSSVSCHLQEVFPPRLLPALLPHHSLGGSCTEAPADPPGNFEEVRPESPGGPRHHTLCLSGSGCSLPVCLQPSPHMSVCGLCISAFSTSEPLPASLFVSLHLHSLSLGLPLFPSVSLLSISLPV